MLSLDAVCLLLASADAARVLLVLITACLCLYCRCLCCRAMLSTELKQRQEGMAQLQQRQLQQAFKPQPQASRSLDATAVVHALTALNPLGSNAGQASI